MPVSPEGRARNQPLAGGTSAAAQVGALPLASDRTVPGTGRTAAGILTSPARNALRAEGFIHHFPFPGRLIIIKMLPHSSLQHKFSPPPKPSSPTASTNPALPVQTKSISREGTR